MDKTKICIGIPTSGTIKSSTVFSLCSLFKDPDFEPYIIIRESSLVHQNRESIAREVLESGCPYLLFIDSDMVFKPEAVKALLSRDKDIIGANTHLRKLPLTSTVKLHNEKGEKVYTAYNSTFECQAVGTGFMLIKTKVFKELSHPWFFFKQDDEGKLTCGEDMWFCNKARDKGFKIWCDPTIEVGHIGDYTY